MLLVPLPPKGKCHEPMSDFCFPTSHSAFPANEESIRELKRPPRYYRKDATFPDEMEEWPEDPSLFDGFNFEEPPYDIMHYYEDRYWEEYERIQITARDTERSIPEGYDGPKSPSQEISAASVENRLDVARAELFMKKASILAAETAPVAALNNMFFGNVFDIRHRQKEWEDQIENQETQGDLDLSNPICLKIIGCSDQYREAYTEMLYYLPGHQDIPFLSSSNVTIPPGKGRKIGRAVISKGCLAKVKDNIRGHTEWFAKPILRPCSGIVLVKYVDAKSVILINLSSTPFLVRELDKLSTIRNSASFARYVFPATAVQAMSALEIPDDLHLEKFETITSDLMSITVEATRNDQQENMRKNPLTNWPRQSQTRHSQTF